MEQKIEIKSYDSVAFKKTWVARVRSMWAGAAIGLAAGVAIGLLAPFLPVIAGLLIPSIGASASIGAAFAAIPASVATFGTSVMITGSLVGAMVGASSGAVGAIAEEMEKRGVEKEKTNTGKSSVVNISQPELKSFGRREYRYFNPKIMAVFGAFGAIAGAVVAASGLAASGGALAMPALVPVLGDLASNAVAVASYTIGVMALGSSLFGVNFPEMVNSTQKFMGRLLGGEALGTSWKRDKTEFVVREQKFDSYEQAVQLQPAPVVGKHTSKVISERPAKVDSYRDLVSSRVHQENAGTEINI